MMMMMMMMMMVIMVVLMLLLLESILNTLTTTHWSERYAANFQVVVSKPDSYSFLCDVFPKEWPLIHVSRVCLAPRQNYWNQLVIIIIITIYLSSQ